MAGAGASMVIAIDADWEATRPNMECFGGCSMCCVTAVDKTSIGKYRSAKNVLQCRLSQGKARRARLAAGLAVGGGARE
jgi:hypothetical protein